MAGYYCELYTHVLSITADDGDDELQYPVSCESASEDEQVITSALTVKQKLKWSEECCSEADDPQDLVMTGII